MSEGYEETIAGQRLMRRPPTMSHEILVARLHQYVAAALPLNSTLRLLPPRSKLDLGEKSLVRPDLAVVRMERGAAYNHPGQLYLVAEVLQPGDHHIDTVIKKQVWTDGNLPRLWIIDPRYLNVEVYGRGENGFGLLTILANHHVLTDPYLPGLSCTMDQLFAGS